ncbi:MAG TPA: tetratricopeptide repeat protein [Bryobacteraceae bacterium]|nr:tetratricopeptide repeat protein [Bryobacteraceae bacterium]
MVSRLAVTITLAAGCWAQGPVSAVAFKQDTPALSRESSTPTKITPEMRGDIQMARKMYREAVESYSLADVKSPIIVNKIGIAYHQMLELELARKHYERALKLDPKYSEALNNLGTIYYAKKNYRRAVSFYNRALKLKPLAASIHSNLGTAQFARKKYKDAAIAYEKALSIDPEVFEHRGSNGVLLQERSVTERALFHFYLAKTYAKAGAVERALTYIRKSLEEGFKEREKFQKEPEFAMLQELPEFQALMASEPRVL